MEFFKCPCPGRGNVIIDEEKDLGPNKDESGKLLKKKTNEGLHKISLKCAEGKKCEPLEPDEIHIHDTDPIEPKEVPFKCA